ncbi:hypothetical protein UNSWDHB_314 [Dehalobacter sp. UNSWDHB]|jgi:hypothetical protein|uniref:hypothetical protein n=1 Tax=unclassified Dehalobacter TaxID=2635733 RepID=UPI00028A6D4B|nr:MULTISPECIES: hypothetical protein [unclassified Dehalobacter]AFV03483.1 hypothetical protein DHBDCA_p2456 [Dehalobacter sp. DCA]AFV06469.1 hypothetical protein DCF50_p2466 [Dehalobacter sp. CF]EQB22361.1 hypothetical protein UNSWDHB_314 [Dehalobacter sp. UNSWDHB]
MRELIEISKGFQTSVNIAYDLNNDDKVRGFIPTMSSLDVIEDVLLSTVPTSTQRARILIGAYGRGKSHIILVLLSMLFRKGEDTGKALFGALLEKMKASNPDLYRFAIEYINSDQKILPIVVRGSSTSLTQSFLSAIQQALSEEGFSDLMPETHFKAAVNQIEKWRDEYHDTYKKLKATLSKSVSDFILALNEYDVNAYEEFAQVYPTLTSGSMFNPFLGFDIVDLYENITVKLKDKGYCGVYVIYDEFSKYLESSIASATNSDIKLLQDFAEKCNRSGNTQMHLMLISHKDIANYIDSNLPKDKVDGWRGVSGRFKHVNLHNNYSQMYEIISAVIKKNPALWEPFLLANRLRFGDFKDRFIKNGLLDKNNQDEVTTAIEGCYPLHPISTFILPRLSEKVAQNERTLFTFLSADEKHTLSDFIASAGDFELLTPDYIYDYFEPLLRKEPYTSEAHKIYKLTASVLRRVEGKPLHEKIIKTIALIYLVEQFEKLPPVVDVIVDAYRDSFSSTKEIDLTLKDLIDNDCVVYLKRSNNYLKIKETSGVDIQEEIAKYKAQRLSVTTATKILNESAFDSYMYPTAYNDANNIIRYFDFTFIDSKDFWAITDWDRKISGSNADGVIYAIIPGSEDEIEKLRQAILSDNNPHERIVFILPKKWVDITKDALDYAAVTYLKNEAAESGDEILNDEYAIYVEDLSDVVGSFINSYARPEKGSAYYFYNANQNIFRRKAQLSGLLSDICGAVFNRTPIINNESINKNDLPTVAINSRTKILAGLLANELAPNIGLSGTGQDVSIMRSTLIKTGVLENADTDPRIQLQPADNRMTDLLTQISTFFTENAARHDGVSFQSLYDTLTLHRNGFGLKYGVIPIYIALVLHLYKNNLVILYRGNEVKITPELLNDINESPSEYSVILENWNEEKAQYMAQLEEVFSEFVTEREKAYNSFTYLFLAMNRWYLSLPKFAKESTQKYSENNKPEKIAQDRRKFLGSLKQMNVNPREFLFEKIFDTYGYRTFNVNVVDNIKATKDEYDGAVKNLIVYLNNAVKTLFASGKSNGSLASTIKDWYETLSERTRQHLFFGSESKILELMATVTNDENSFIQRLTKAVTYLRIDDWNSDTVDIFLRDLQAFKETVEGFNAQTDSDKQKTSSYEIIFTDADGVGVVKRFNKTAYSDRAKLLLNEIKTAIEEMGQSISEHEKRQVLIDILERLSK